MEKVLPIILVGLLSTSTFAQDLAVAQQATTEGSATPTIDLVSFEARTNGTDGVILLWSTLSERAGDHFRIERSQDLVHWEVLELVEGHGAPGVHTPYETADPTPLPGVSYYRLADPKATGGDQELSDIFSVRTAAVDPLLITPDQRPGCFVVSAEGDLDDVRLMDNRGQFIPMSIQPSDGRLVVNAELLPPGTYYLQASVDGTPHIKPVFITSNGIIGG